MIREYAVRPTTGLRVARALHAYRLGQEALRRQRTDTDIARMQIRWAADKCRDNDEFVESCVRRWMQEVPLRYLSAFVQDGLPDFLRTAKSFGLQLAVCSDYPADAKLRAMGLNGFFDAVVCAQDADVQAFKPNPRMIAVALTKLGVRPEQAVFVGDRADVDAEAACQAGIPCFILGNSGTNGKRTGSDLHFSSYVEFLADFRRPYSTR
jgi:phosphoglycolate phosphatase/putative hydrolase of the HAD superfamily